MAEANPNPQGTPGKAAQPAAGNTPAGQQQQSPQPAQSPAQLEPKWLSYIQDPAEREEAKKSYLLHSDYTKKTQSLAEQQKAWETEKQKLQTEAQKWTDWYAREYGPFYQRYQQHKDQIDAILAGQVAAQHPQEPDPFDNYDLLPPAEQAKRLADYVGNNVLASQFEALKKEFANQLSQKEQFFANYLAIQNDAFNRKFQNPELDMQQYIQKAMEVAQGKINPLEVAYNAVTSESSLKKMQDEWMKKGKEEAELEIKNRQQANGALQQPFVPIFKQQPMSRAQIRETVRAEAAQKGINWNNSSG